MKPIIAAAFVVGSAFAVQAADLPARVPAAAPVVTPGASAYSWSGFYVGAQVGWAQLGSDYQDFEINDPTNNFVAPGKTADGFVGGVHAGYNIQHGAFVLGVEADLEGSNLKIDYQTSFEANNWGYKATIGAEGSVRARAGYAFNQALLYVTGGVAIADVSISRGGGAYGREKFSDTRFGWTLGAGVEHAFTKSLSARVEYRYTDYGTVSNVPVVIWQGIREENTIKSQAVRVGLSYRFGAN